MCAARTIPYEFIEGILDHVVSDSSPGPYLAISSLINISTASKSTQADASARFRSDLATCLERITGSADNTFYATQLARRQLSPESQLRLSVNAEIRGAEKYHALISTLAKSIRMHFENTPIVLSSGSYDENLSLDENYWIEAVYSWARFGLEQGSELNALPFRYPTPIWHPIAIRPHRDYIRQFLIMALRCGPKNEEDSNYDVLTTIKNKVNALKGLRFGVGKRLAQRRTIKGFQNQFYGTEGWKLLGLYLGAWGMDVQSWDDVKRMSAEDIWRGYMSTEELRRQTEHLNLWKTYRLRPVVLQLNDWMDDTMMRFEQQIVFLTEDDMSEFLWVEFREKYEKGAEENCFKLTFKLDW